MASKIVPSTQGTKQPIQKTTMNLDLKDTTLLSALPYEILANIIQHLDVYDILNLAFVDSAFAEFLPDDVYYEEYLGVYQSYYPENDRQVSKTRKGHGNRNYGAGPDDSMQKNYWEKEEERRNSVPSWH